MSRNRRPQLPVDLDRLRVPRAIGLSVTWRAGRRLDGGNIRMSEGVADHLREACKTTLTRVRGSQARPYSPDMHLETEEILYANDPDLITESPLADVLFAEQPLSTISARSLPDRPFGPLRRDLHWPRRSGRLRPQDEPKAQCPRRPHVPPAREHADRRRQTGVHTRPELRPDRDAGRRHRSRPGSVQAPVQRRRRPCSRRFPSGSGRSPTTFHLPAKAPRCSRRRR